MSDQYESKLNSYRIFGTSLVLGSGFLLSASAVRHVPDTASPRW
jgi:hypothetical protein